MFSSPNPHPTGSVLNEQVRGQVIQVVDAALQQPSTHGGSISSILPALSQLGMWPGPAAVDHVMDIVEREVAKLVDQRTTPHSCLTSTGLRGLLWAACVAPRNTFALDRLARLVDAVLESNACAADHGATALYILNVAKQARCVVEALVVFGNEAVSHALLHATRLPYLWMFTMFESGHACIKRALKRAL